MARASAVRWVAAAVAASAISGSFASQQTILWSRPAAAAVGTPNPGKAGHVSVTNATHFVAAGGMGEVGSENMPSNTADVLDLRTSKWIRTNIPLDMGSAVVDDHAGKANAPQAIGHAFVIGGAKTTIDPITRETTLTPLDQTLAFDASTLMMKTITVTKGETNAPGAVRGASVAYLFNANDRTDSSGMRKPRPAVVVYGGVKAAGTRVNDVHVLYLGDGTTPDLANGEWYVPGALGLPGQSAPANAYGAMATTSLGNGAVVMGGYNAAGKVTADTWVLTSEIPPPPVVAEGEEPKAAAVPLLNVARGRVPKVSSNSNSAGTLTDGSTSTSWQSSIQDDPYFSIDVGAPVGVDSMKLTLWYYASSLRKQMEDARYYVSSAKDIDDIWKSGAVTYNCSSTWTDDDDREATVTCPDGTSGQHVHVTIPGIRRRMYYIYEVEVYSPLDWRWTEVPQIAALPQSSLKGLSTYSTFYNTRAVDGDTSSYVYGYSRNAAGVNYRVELPAVKKVSAVDVWKPDYCSTICDSSFQSSSVYVSNEASFALVDKTKEKCAMPTKTSDWFPNGKQFTSIDCTGLQGKYVYFQTIPSEYTYNAAYMYLGQIYVKVTKTGFPTPRARASATQFRGYAFFYGGVGDLGQVINELSVFDTSNKIFLGTDAVSAIGTPPPGRSRLQMAQLGSDAVGFFGGLDFSLTRARDFWRLKFDDCAPLPTTRFIAAADEAYGVTYYTCQSGATAANGNNPVLCGITGRLNGALPVCRGPAPSKPRDVMVEPGSAKLSVKVTWKPPAEYNTVAKRKELVSYYLRPAIVGEFKELWDGTAAGKTASMALLSKRGWAVENDDSDKLDIHMTGRSTTVIVAPTSGCSFSGTSVSATCPMLVWTGAQSDAFSTGLTIKWNTEVSLLESNWLPKQNSFAAVWLVEKTGGRKSNNWDFAIGGDRDSDQTYAYGYGTYRTEYKYAYVTPRIYGMRAGSTRPTYIASAYRRSFYAYTYTRGGYDYLVHSDYNTKWSYNCELALGQSPTNLKCFYDYSYSRRYRYCYNAACSSSSTWYGPYDYSYTNYWIGSSNGYNIDAYLPTAPAGQDEPPAANPMAALVFANPLSTASNMTMTRLEVAADSCAPAVAPLPVVMTPVNETFESYEIEVPNVPRDTNASFKILAASDMGYGEESDPSNKSPAKPGDPIAVTGQLLDTTGWQLSSTPSNPSYTYYWKIENLFSDSFFYTYFRYPSTYPVIATVDMTSTQVITDLIITTYSGTYMQNSEFYISENASPSGTKTKCTTPVWRNYADHTVQCNNARGRYLHMYSRYSSSTFAYFYFRKMAVYGRPSPDNCPVRPTRATSAAVPAYMTASTDCNTGKPGTVCLLGCQSAAGKSYYPLSGVAGATCNKGSWDASELVCGQYCPKLPAVAGLRKCTESLVRRTFSNTGDLNDIELRKGDFMYFETTDPTTPVVQYWTVQDGMLATNGLLRDSCTKDYGISVFFPDADLGASRDDLTAKTRFQTEGGAGMLLRWTDASNFIIVTIDISAQTWQAKAVVSGTATVLAGTTLRYPLGQFEFHELEVAMSGSTFTMYIDGTLEATFEQSDLQTGFVGLASMYKAVTFDYIEVTSDCTGTGCTAGSIEDSCAFTCAAGYTQVGPKVAYCEGTYPGTPAWSDDSISCQLIPPSVGNYTLAVAENSAKDTEIGPDKITAVIEAADQQVAYGIAGVYSVDAATGALVMMGLQDQRTFAIDVCSGQMSVNRPVLDYESQSVYVVRVRAYVASQSTAEAFSYVTVNIIDVNEPPVITSRMLFIEEVAEGPVRAYGKPSMRRDANGTLVMSGVQVKDPEDNAVRFEITESGNALEDGLFEIDASTGSIRSRKPNVTSARELYGQLDFEQTSQYVINVRVVETSTEEKLQGTAQVVISATDLNDYPDVRSAMDPDAAWASSMIVVTAKDIDISGSTFSGVMFEPPLKIVDEDVTNGTYGERTMVVAVDDTAATLNTLDVERIKARYELGSDDALAAALYTDLVNASVSFPTIQGTKTGTSMFRLDAATNKLAFSTDPVPAGTTGYEQRPGFFFRGQLVRQAYAVPVKLDDGYGGVTTVPVVAVVTADPGSNPYITQVSTGGAASNTSSTLPTDGGLEVRFTGRNIAQGADVKVSLGRTGVAPLALTGCTVPTENLIVCSSPVGSGKGWLWKVEVKAGGTYISATFLDLTQASAAFTPPAITAIRGNTGLNTRSSPLNYIYLDGTNLGSRDATKSFAYGCTLNDVTGQPLAKPVCKFGCRQSVYSTGHELYRCYTDASAGQDLDWVYEVDGQIVTSAGREEDRISHTPPSVNTNSDRSVGVTTPSQALSTSPNTDGYTITTLDTAGGQKILIQGANFGPVGTDIEVRFGNGDAMVGALSNCRQGTGASAHSQITCDTLAYAGRFHALKVIAAGVEALSVTNTSTQGLGYLPPVITEVSGRGAFGSPTEGGANVYITGRHFGPKSGSSVLVDSVYYGPPSNTRRFRATGCTVVSEPPASSQLLCQTAPGTGRNHSWSVSIGTQVTADFAAGTFYAAPIIASFSGAGAVDADTDGGEVVTISGSNFGPGGSEYVFGRMGSFEVKYTVKLDDFRPAGGDMVPQYSFVPSRCTILGHTSIECVTNDGVGDRLAWNIIIDEQVSTEPVTDYGPPEVVSVVVYPGSTPTGTPLSNNQNCDPAGGQYVEVTGKNFGPAGVSFGNLTGSFLQAVRYGPTGTEYLPSFDLVGRGHTKLYFVTKPGSGSNLRISVIVGDQISSPSDATIGFAPPEVLTVTPSSGPTLSKPESPTVVSLEVKNAPIKDERTDIVVVFGNGAFQAVMRPQAPRELPNGNSAIDFSLPKDGAGMDIPVRVGVVAAKAPTSSLRLDVLGNGDGVSQATAASMFSYEDPVIRTVVNGRPFFRTSVNETADCEAALFNNGFSAQASPDRNLWSCSDQRMREIVLIGSNFGGHPDKMARSDGVARFIELQSPDPSTGIMTWSSDDVVIYEWDHNRVSFFTLRQRATVRVRLQSQGYDLTAGRLADRQQIVETTFAEQSPGFSALESGTDLSSVPTTGGTADLSGAIGMDVTDLTTTTSKLIVFIGNKPAALLDPANGDPLPPPPTNPSDPADPNWPDYGNAVRAKISANPTTQPGGLAVWKLYAVIPAGQGAKVAVRLERFDGASALSSDEKYFSYARPAIATFSVVEGSTVSPPKVATRETIRIPTDASGKVRLIGTNLGPCPAVRVDYFDEVFSADSYTTSAGSTVDCTVYQETARAAFRGKVRPCPSTEGAHTCYEFDTMQGEGDGTQLGLAQGYTVSLLASGESDTDGGFVSTPSGLRLAYQAAGVDSVMPLSTGGFPTEGGAPVKLTGSNFGIFPSASSFNQSQDVTVMFGTDATGYNLPCAGVNRMSHSELTCSLPEGSGLDLKARVVVAGIQGTSAGPVLSYTPPSVTSMSIVEGGVVTRTVSSTDADFVIGGPTTGGYTLVIEGVNFGAMSEYFHCTFLAWSSRLSSSFSCGLTATTRAQDDFIGQGKVASASVMAHSHRRIEVTVPEGMGSKDLEVYVRGNMLGTSGPRPRFVYDAPVIAGPLTPATAPTVGGEVITIAGSNFGPAPTYSNATSGIPLSVAAGLPIYMLRVSIEYPGCTSDPAVECPCVTNAKGFAGVSTPGRVTDCRVDPMLVHGHSEVKFAIPDGIGLDRKVNVELLDASEQSKQFLPAKDFAAAVPASFSYDAPVIDLTNPQTVRMHGITTGGDAQVRAVDLIGRNFGNFEKADEQGWTQEERELVGSVASVPCTDISRRREEGETVVRCSMTPTTVGYKNISVKVAGQNGFRDIVPRTRALHAVCDNDWFGRPDQVCLPCPQGGVCMGYVAELVATPEQVLADPTVAETIKHTMPVPEAGWFNLNSSDSFVGESMADACPPNFIIEGRDVCIAPCSPRSSCTGENFCAIGYRSKAPEFRCSSCDLGFYRRAGSCAKCPDSPALLIAVFVVLAIGAAIAAWYLNRSNVDVALVQIGVDYFQVLAIFASARITWPPFIQDVFHVMSAFNLNLEITAPECLVPDIAFVTKWLIMMGIPLGCAFVLLVAWAVGLCYNKASRGGSWAQINAHAGKIIAGYMVMLYFLYLHVSKQILDIFNCAPTDPPDGKLYLSAVFEPCDKPGGVHETLLVPAIVALAVYTIGFPVFCLYITSMGNSKETIMLDQLLRCFGTGYTLPGSTSRTRAQMAAFEFRKKYNRLYYAFRPEFYFWIVALLVRKFLIALAALMFADAPDFQMAFVLLVLFSSYTLQVYFRPYLSRDEFKAAAAEWKAKSDAAKMAGNSSTSVYFRVQGDFDSIANAKGELFRAINSDLSRGGGASLSAAAAAGRGRRSAFELMGPLAKNLMNYNTVATFLLASAILVCLSGIMFESGRLDREGADASRDAVTAVALAIIFITLIYLAVVFAVELILVCNNGGRCMRGAAAKKADKEMETELTDTGDVALKTTSTNPMVSAKSSSSEDDTEALKRNAAETFRMDMALVPEEPPKDVESWRAFRERFREQAAQVAELSRSVADLRREKAVLGTASGAGASTRAAAAAFKRAGSSGKLRASRRMSAKPSKAGERKNPLKKV